MTLKKRTCIECGEEFLTDDIVKLICDECDTQVTNEKLLRCAWCGCLFEKKYSVHKYCSEECRKEKNRELDRQRNKEYAEKKRKKKKLAKDIIRLTREAREKGMSYGQYVGMLEMNKDKHV